MSNRVTRERLIEMLSNPNPAYVKAVIGRALVVLLNRQTRAEAQANQTQEHNMIGFTGADARSGSITAKYWLKNKDLQDWQVERWTRRNTNNIPRLAKYWKQLDDEAQRKAS